MPALLLIFLTSVFLFASTSGAAAPCAFANDPEIYQTEHGLVVGGLQTLSFGGTCGGGGIIVKFREDSDPVLLDRLSLNPNLQSSALVRAQRADERFAEIEAASTEDQQSVREALLRVRAWHEAVRKNKEDSALILEMIYQQLQTMPLFKTAHTFNTVPRFDLPPSVLKRRPSVVMAILFIPQKGALISSPVWNSLDVKTKMGLLIHESLRQVQLSYFLTDLQVQKITATILDLEPSAATDFTIYYPPLLLQLGDTFQNSPAARRATLDIFRLLNKAQFEEMQKLLQGPKAHQTLRSLVNEWIRLGLLKK